MLCLTLDGQILGRSPLPPSPSPFLPPTQSLSDARWADTNIDGLSSWMSRVASDVASSVSQSTALPFPLPLFFRPPILLASFSFPSPKKDVSSEKVHVTRY